MANGKSVYTRRDSQPYDWRDWLPLVVVAVILFLVVFFDWKV